MNAKRIVFLAGILFAGIASAANDSSATGPSWKQETLRAFASVPIQDGGRIKPLETYANVQLLKLNGMRRCKTPDGKSIDGMVWFLDVLFYPSTARTYKSFLIESADVMAMLALQSEKERDRFSYDELFPSRQTLFELAGQFAAIPDESRSPAQRQTINLAHNVHDFEQLMHYFDFARESFPVGESELMARTFDGKSAVKWSEVLRAAPSLLANAQHQSSAHADTNAHQNSAFAAITDLLRNADTVAARAQGMTMFPPTARDEAEWVPLGRLLESALGPGGLQPEILDALAAIESIAQDPTGPDQSVHANTVHNALASLAEARGEYEKVALELTLLRLNPFYYSLILFVISFLLVAISWARPKSIWLWRASIAVVSLASSALVLGIVLRCIIRSRPPVTTLYETILFITAVAVATAVFIEWVNRQRIAISLAAALGSIGVFLANKYELVERGDTMPSMIAVLDTNFWLSTHVTTVTMGYAAGLLASALAHVYIICWALGLKKNEPQFYRMLARMTYGVLCFGLLFATTGTVLGGIWANNSWGRFWGWDPKENGALMIVLWQLIVLHSRLAGYIRDFGVVMGAVFGGIIVAFSWFGVNLLGVGLHSYGFTSGIATALSIFYTSQLCVLFLGALTWIWRALPPPTETPASSRPNA